MPIKTAIDTTSPDPRPESAVAPGEVAELLFKVRITGDQDFRRLLGQVAGWLDAKGVAAWGGPAGAGHGYLFSSAGPREAGGDVEAMAQRARPQSPRRLHDLIVNSSADPTLRGWVAMYSHRPITPRQTTLFHAVLPVLQRRAHFEWDLAGSPSAHAVVRAALQAIPGPAFLVDRAAYVHRLNTAGKALAHSDPTQLACDLISSLAGLSTTFAITPLLDEPHAQPAYILAPTRNASADRAPRLALATAQWHLSQRQVSVLAGVVVGDTNRSIAEQVGLAETTVELHVTELLRRAGVANRAALVATFWRM